jgi:alpha-galactosidase/6-phospho-beta-glucosidase family protein
VARINPLPVGGGSPPSASRRIQAQGDKQPDGIAFRVGPRGDRLLALQALLADPLVDAVSVASARAILDELLQAHAAYVPTFS